MDNAVVFRLPSVDIPEDVSFKVSTKKNGKRTLRGEHGNISYEGQEDQGQKYCLAIKDSKTGKIQVVEVPIMDVVVQMKDKQEEAKAAIRQSGVQNWIQRTSLGEAFGTKKAKTAINDRERNRLDADMLGDLEGAIVDTVKDQTANLPSHEERHKAMAAERPIPPYDLETRNVEEIYRIDSIVPPRELNMLRVDELANAATEEERAQFLPLKTSDYVNSRITRVINENVNVKPRLRILAYISLLLSVYANRRASSKQILTEKLGNPPESLVDGILERFTVSKAGHFGRSKDRSFAFDPARLDKLLSYTLALMLHIDEFEVDITPLSHELSMPSKRIGELFRGLGCSLRNLTSAQAQARNLPSSVAKSYKLAKLTAPLNLPEVVKRSRQN